MLSLTYYKEKFNIKKLKKLNKKFKKNYREKN